MSTLAKSIALESLFTKAELKERERHVQTLRQFGRSSVEAAKAISAIRERKLYRPHSTLKEFCEMECGWTYRRLRQVEVFLDIKKALPKSEQSSLTNETQARELAKVPKEDRLEVLLDAASNGQATPAKIRESAKKVASKNGVYDDMGFPIPTGDASYYWSRKVDIEKILLGLQSIKRELAKVQTDDPLWNVIHPNGVIHDVENAISRITGGMPAYVCVYCEGLKPRGCQVCKGVGLVSRFVWKNMPAKYREIREQECASH